MPNWFLREPLRIETMLYTLDRTEEQRYLSSQNGATIDELLQKNLILKTCSDILNSPTLSVSTSTLQPKLKKTSYTND